ncbi:hypothetical protein NQZ68_008438 [Dissostichus eleginoides]|nr:hypothetical protein NQZ68_008438 [Dissostichus eleginoides]
MQSLMVDKRCGEERVETLQEIKEVTCLWDGFASGAKYKIEFMGIAAKRRDFNAGSVTKNAVVCGAHFRQEDYEAGDLMEFRMGYRSQDRQLPVAAGVMVKDLSEIQLHENVNCAP